MGSLWVPGVHEPHTASSWLQSAQTERESHPSGHSTGLSVFLGLFFMNSSPITPAREGGEHTLNPEVTPGGFKGRISCLTKCNMKYIKWFAE